MRFVGCFAGFISDLKALAIYTLSYYRNIADLRVFFYFMQFMFVCLFFACSSGHSFRGPACIKEVTQGKRLNASEAY